MMKFSIVTGLVIIVAAIAGYLVQQQYSLTLEDQAAIQAISSDRVEFVLPHLDGSERRLSDWDGEARIVNFWATWCAPCRREIPILKQLQTDKPEKQLQVIGIAVDFMDDVRAYAEEARFNYPILVGQEEAIAVAEVSGVEFIGLPFTMIIAADGTLVATHMGEIMQPHVDRISEVMRDLASGALDLETARSELQKL
jgi:thiol-disulfide isomerase/thioredoxin